LLKEIYSAFAHRKHCPRKSGEQNREDAQLKILEGEIREIKKNLDELRTGQCNGISKPGNTLNRETQKKRGRKT
jgi:hypothetical protein